MSAAGSPGSTGDITSIVLVGGGLASASAAEELRSAGYDGDLTLLAAEDHPPYERPPLSKAVLLGDEAPDASEVHDAQWYADQGIDLRLAEPAESLDLAAGHVTTARGEIPFDRLLMATGARPRRLAQLDEAGISTAYLRTREESADLAGRLASGRLLVVGGGWIGLEVAAAARTRGADVTLVETQELPLVGVLGPEVAQVFADLHVERGVDLRTATTITGVEALDGGRTRATLSDESTVEADLVLVAVGVAPDVSLARSAGLAVDDGVVVDATLRTSDPRVYAAGDIARHAHPVLGEDVRVEHWDAAIHQGKHAARAMLADAGDYDRLPYFFTDQYDLGMEYVGHTGRAGADRVVLEGDVTGRVFTAWWLRDDVVRAGMHVNDWDAIDRVRAQVGRPLDDG